MTWYWVYMFDVEEKCTTFLMLSAQFHGARQFHGIRRFHGTTWFHGTRKDKIGQGEVGQIVQCHCALPKPSSMYNLPDFNPLTPLLEGLAHLFMLFIFQLTRELPLINNVSSFSNDSVNGSEVSGLMCDSMVNTMVLFCGYINPIC